MFEGRGGVAILLKGSLFETWWGEYFYLVVQEFVFGRERLGDRSKLIEVKDQNIKIQAYELLMFQLQARACWCDFKILTFFQFGETIFYTSIAL